LKKALLFSAKKEAINIEHAHRMIINFCQEITVANELQEITA
jgi:hypothetical protein